MNLSPNYHVEARGLQPAHYPREYDFCSWRCLSEFAASRMDKRMGAVGREDATCRGRGD